MRIKGEARPVGVVVDVGGRVLNIELSGEGFDYEGWLESMADELGVEVVVTDDSTDYSIPMKIASLTPPHRHSCEGRKPSPRHQSFKERRNQRPFHFRW